MNKLSEKEIRTVLEATEKLGTITSNVIEKDIFVTKAIHLIAELNHSSIDTVFCGGTCLSKAYQIVSRMSEDVDFKVFPVVPFTSQSEQRRKLGNFRDEVTDVLKNAGFKIQQQNLRSRDNNSYIVYHLDYDSYFNPRQELRPHIQLEFNFAFPLFPTQLLSVASLADRAFPETNVNEKNITCISVLEAAAEKWVAITRRIASIARGHDPMDETLVRHLYDLQAITEQISLTKDFFELVMNTIKRDRTKFKKHHEYKANTLEEIRYSLKLLKTDPIWVKSFDDFVDAMVFSKNIVKFNNCYERLEKISEQIFSYVVGASI